MSRMRAGFEGVSAVEKRKIRGRLVQSTNHLGRASDMTTRGVLYKPGDRVPESGIYKVVHFHDHHAAQEVTCIAGQTFPACRWCGERVRFESIREANYIEIDDNLG